MSFLGRKTEGAAVNCLGALTAELLGGVQQIHPCFLAA